MENEMGRHNSSSAYNFRCSYIETDTHRISLYGEAALEQLEEMEGR